MLRGYHTNPGRRFQRELRRARPCGTYVLDFAEALGLFGLTLPVFALRNVGRAMVGARVLHWKLILPSRLEGWSCAGRGRLGVNESEGGESDKERLDGHVDGVR